MPSKYNRKNRDRRGGHKSNYVVDCSGSNANYKVHEPSRVARSCIKQLTKKVARRQHAKAIAEGMQEYDSQAMERQSCYMDDEDYDPYYWDWKEYEEEYEEDEGSFYDPFYSPFDDSFYGSSYDPFDLDDDCNRPYVPVSPDNVIVTYADDGKTLRELAEENGFHISASRYHSY